MREKCQGRNKRPRSKTRDWNELNYIELNKGSYSDA